jgi:hypothetical protein
MRQVCIRKGTIDPEGIAITPQGTVWIASEEQRWPMAGRKELSMVFRRSFKEHDIETGKIVAIVANSRPIYSPN